MRQTPGDHSINPPFSIGYSNCVPIHCQALITNRKRELMPRTIAIILLGLVTGLTACQRADTTTGNDFTRLTALTESGTPTVQMWISGFA